MTCTRPDGEFCPGYCCVMQGETVMAFCKWDSERPVDAKVYDAEHPYETTSATYAKVIVSG